MKKFNDILNIFTGVLIGLILILLDSIDITYIIIDKIGLSFGIFEKGILFCTICLSTICLSLKFGEIIKVFNIDLKNKIIVNGILAFFIYLIYFFNTSNKNLLILINILLIVFIITSQLVISEFSKVKVKRKISKREDLGLSDLNTVKFLESENYVITDSPIGNTTNDIININIFIESLLEYIKRVNTLRSFRIGLIGKWGVGKTSIVNLLRNKNKELSNENMKEEKIVFIDFSPWKYSNIKEMTMMLYERIAQNISNNYSNAYDRILLEKYKRYINSLINNKIGFDVEYEEENDFAKREIENTILSTNKKFVVVIDDIDRLKTEQIKHLFDFIYNILDFDRIIFIMCYDEEKINRIYNEEYNYYFDKVINAKIYVPTIQKETLDHVFKYGIYSYIKKHKIKVADEAELDKVINLVSEEFDDIRSISEFFNMLEFDLIISEKNDLYLNDIIALSFIKYKYHDLYIDIYYNYKTFIRYGAKDTNEYMRIYKDNIKELIGVMFPSNTYIIFDKDIYLKNKRICDENFFINYFSQGRNKYLDLYIGTKVFLSNLSNKENMKESITKFFNKYDSIEIKLILDVLIAFYDAREHEDLYVNIISSLQRNNINFENFLFEFIERAEHPFKIIKKFSADIIIMDKLYNKIKNNSIILKEDKKTIEKVIEYIYNVLYKYKQECIKKNKNIYNKRNYKKGIGIILARLSVENEKENSEYKKYISKKLSHKTIFRILYDCIIISDIETTPSSYIFSNNDLELLGFSYETIKDYLNNLNISLLNQDQKKIVDIFKNKYERLYFKEKINADNL